MQASRHHSLIIYSKSYTEGSDTFYLKQKDTAKIIVSDTGCGISAADRKRMYERFYRAPSASDKPGSGLGLATVREIVVKRYNGKIDCHSEVGNGTTFTVTLPLATTQGKA